MTELTLCDPMWHVSSRSSVATLRTAIHFLLTYLLKNNYNRSLSVPFLSSKVMISSDSVRHADVRDGGC